MKNHQVLYRKDADYAYLVLLYDDLKNKPNTIPNVLFAFREPMSNEKLNKKYSPTIVNNIHEKNVYHEYLDRGWIDITDSNNLLPIPVKVWLIQNSN